MPAEDPIRPTPPPAPPRRAIRVPSGRRFAAGAVASVAAVFGVLALRVHDGDDPALSSAKAASKSSPSTGSSASSSPSTGDTTNSSSSDTTGDPSSDATTGSADDGSGAAVTATPGATTSAS